MSSVYEAGAWNSWCAAKTQAAREQVRAELVANGIARPTRADVDDALAARWYRLPACVARRVWRSIERREQRVAERRSRRAAYLRSLLPPR